LPEIIIHPDDPDGSAEFQLLSIKDTYSITKGVNNYCGPYTIAFPDQTLPVTLTDEDSYRFSVGPTDLLDDQTIVSTIEISFTDHPDLEAQSFELPIEIVCRYFSIESTAPSQGAEYIYVSEQEPLMINFVYDVTPSCGKPLDLTLWTDPASGLFATNDDQ